ncbi:UNKNOWN [Stylonychia lemnae]|uniref:Nmda receptor glutamate-binding chain n=1 Tax=Stylonychia lemnae TaxID=5949 RepID=A0A078BAP6_STYLE|nr:UNKNOWN [Stylonychia lemnae]|eukprot:CDW91296.1 UNKNOWN [Stylonychia lemnae]
MNIEQNQQARQLDDQDSGYRLQQNRARDENPYFSNKILDEEDQLGFIRKVYGILLTQITITALCSLLPLVDEGARLFLIRNQSVVIFLMILAIVIQCGMFCIQSLARTAPINYVLMFGFTICEAYIVAFICATVRNPLIVAQAAFMTAGIVFALTLYAVQSKTDFTVMGGMAFVLAVGFIMFSMLSFLFGPTMRLIYCTLGVLIFGFYLVIDTQLLIGGRRYQLDKDDYILAAVILYLDIINIFLYILQILTQLMGGQKE